MSQVFGTRSRRGYLWAVLLVVLVAIAGFFGFRQEPSPTDGGNGQVAQETPAPSAPSAALPSDATATETAALEPEPEPAAEPEKLVMSFDVVRVTPEGDAVIAGRSAPLSKVTVMLDGSPSMTVEADRNGNFVAFMRVEAGSEPRVLGLEGATPDGRAGSSEQTVIITPPAPAPEPEPEPVDVATATDGQDETDQATETSAAEAPPEEEAARAPGVLLAGEGGVRLLQPPSPAQGEETPENIVIDAISYDQEGEVAITGRAGLGEFVRVYVNNSPVHVGPVSDDGTWRAELPMIESGVYTLRIDEVDEGGKVKSRVETPFKREEPEVLARAIQNAGGEGKKGVTLVTVQPGYTLWGIATRNYGSGFQYVRIFEANRDQIRNPDLIYPGQIFTVPGEGD